MQTVPFALQQNNLQSFGYIDPTGVNDSTLAIQAAINYSAANGAAIRIPAGTYLCGQITLAPNVTLIGEGREQTIFLCKPGTTGDWWSDRGAGAQKIILEGFALDGQSNASLTNGLTLANGGGSAFGGEGYIRGLYVRNVTAGTGFNVNATFAVFGQISVYNCQTNINITGSANLGSDLISVNSGSGAALNLSSGHWTRVLCESPANTVCPINLGSLGCYVTGLTISLATGTSYAYLVNINATNINQWGVMGMSVVLNGTATATAWFNNNGTTWTGLAGVNTGNFETTRLQVGLGAGSVACIGILYSGLQSLNFGSVAANSGTTLTFNLTGAVVGEPVILGLPGAGPTGALQYTAWCSATGVISVRAYNPTGSAIVASAANFTATQLIF